MKVSKEVKVALLVILGVILFIFGYNYLKNQSLFESSNIYHTEFEFNSLTTSSQVTVKGNIVGKIIDIDYDFESGKTKVSFSINNRLKFSKKSKVKLYEVGPMSGSALTILIDNQGDIAQSGDFLESVVEVGLIKNLSKNFSGLSTDLNSTLKSSDTLLTNINQLIIDESEEGLKATIKNLNETLKSFSNTSNSVNNLVAKNNKNITAVLENFKTVSGDFGVLSSQLKAANIDGAIKDFDKTLNSLNAILADLEKGKGSMGKLLKDEALYDNLEGVSKEMEELLEDIKLHPKRYFRILSKKEIPYEDEN